MKLITFLFAIMISNMAFASQKCDPRQLDCRWGIDPKTCTCKPNPRGCDPKILEVIKCAYGINYDTCGCYTTPKK